MKKQETDRALARLFGAAKKQVQPAPVVKYRRKRDRSGRPPKARSPIESRKFALAGWKVLCARMAPDVWYENSQLVRLTPEFAAGVVGAAIQRGLIERAGHPDWDPGARRTFQDIHLGRPRYVYRLTTEGAAKAAQWRIELGMAQDTGRD